MAERYDFEGERERAKALLKHGRAVKLEDEYEHAVAMGKNTALKKSDRVLWKQLAAEMAARLGLNAPPSKQEELF